MTMHWYGGSIAEAVTLSKQKNAIFVVFVEGDNELSREMTTTIDDEAVLSRLSNQAKFLAVKLKSGTTDYTHFAQIYQFVPVPSLFFIGRNGTPLEVVCAGIQASNLATRIDRILADHYNEKPQPNQDPQPPVKSPQPSTSSSSHVRDATSNLLQAEAQASAPRDIPAPDTPEEPPASPSPPKIAKTAESDIKPAAPKPEFEVVCDGDVCVRRPKGPDMPSTSQAVTVAPMTTSTTPAVLTTAPQLKPLEPSQSSVSAEEKMERAKELIEAKRREKAEKEKELERQKELERRNTGQGVAELKKWQADQEMKQLQEERKREKLENNLARQRILEQIAQDRAERRARDNPPPSSEPVQPQTTSPLPTSGDAGTSTRVQFKLPDGTSHTAHFEATGTLAQVQRYVADNLQLSASSFALWTAFPRRELTDTAATLRELELAPSAALLVLPRRAVAPSSGPTQYFSIYAFITSLLTTYIYEPSVVLYTWVRTRLFPPPAVGPRPPNVPTAPTAPSGPPTATGDLPRAAPLPRRRTNIHRLPGDAANDDDNNTWNGNSTQQM